VKVDMVYGSSKVSLDVLLDEQPNGAVNVRIPVKDVLVVKDAWEELAETLGLEGGGHVIVAVISDWNIDEGDAAELIDPNQSTIYEHINEIHDQVSNNIG